VRNTSRQGAQGGQLLLHEQLILRLPKLPQGVFCLGVFALEFARALFDPALQRVAVIQ
jgi:hypothetical protein